MSKLSVHISSGNRTGFADWLDQCVAGNSPIGIIYSVNENISGDLLQHSPTTKWVYRYQTDEFNRTPNGFLEGDPVKNATEWLTKTKDSHNRTLLQNWALNKADWHDPLNEPVPDIQVKAEWFNTWMLTALELAHQNGFKIAYGSFTTGAPELNVLQYMLPSMRLAKLYGAILSLHAYWEDADPGKEKDNALRYREIYAALPEEARLPIIISEASSGNGYGKGAGLTGQAWVDNMALYDTELMKDPYVLGACGFQLGGQESNLRNALPAYGTYIAKTPTPTDVSMPPPTVEVITPSTQPTADPSNKPTLTELVNNQPSVAISEPLDFTVNVAGCRKDADRPDGIIVTFQFNVVGGSAPYTFIHENKTFSVPTFERLATRSGKIIDNFGVKSGDGQTQLKKLFFSPGDMNCG